MQRRRRGGEEALERAAARTKGSRSDEEAVDGGEVRFSGLGPSDAEETILEGVIAAFEEAYPDITVDYEPIPEGSSTR